MDDSRTRWPGHPAGRPPPAERLRFRPAPTGAPAGASSGARNAARTAAPTAGPTAGRTLELAALPGHRPALAHLPATTGSLLLVVFFHGAGGRPDQSLDVMRAVADRHGFAVLAPASRGPTWDRVLGGFGPDVGNLDALLDGLAAHQPVDRLVLAGFSDGASYALSLGLSNGDLLDGVVALSPGFAAPGARVGKPPLFVSHGERDTVLPVERCSRVLVPALRSDGYDVTYREFAGGHDVPSAVREEAGSWISARR